MAAYITVGAKATHGGTVITGSPYTTHNGVQVSRKGDKVICKKCKKVTTILTGDPSFIVDGAPIAREGDVTSCGAKLIAIQHSFAESDFEVFGVEQPEPLMEQPAPLQFPKSDPDALFASLKASSGDASEEGLVAGNTYYGEPDQGGGGDPAWTDEKLLNYAITYKGNATGDWALEEVKKRGLLPEYEKRLKAGRGSHSGNSIPKTSIGSKNNDVKSAEEYRERIQKSTEYFDKGMSKTGNLIEEAAPMNPTKLSKWGSGAAKVVGNKMKDDIQESDEGILKATGEVISDTFDEAAKKARELSNWWNTDLNPNYPKKDNDD